MKAIFSRLYFLLAIILMISACSSQSGTDQSSLVDSNETKGATTIIEGVFEGAKEQQVYLQHLRPNSIDPIDTVITDEAGQFAFEFNVPQIGYYRIGLGERNLCVLILTPGERVQLTAEASNIYNTYQVKGSPESQRLSDLNKILSERDSIGMQLQQAQMNQDQALFNTAMLAYQEVLSTVSVKIKAFIDADPGKMSSLAAAQNLDPAQDFEYYIKVVDALEGKANGNEFFDGMKEQVQSSRKLAVGSEAPDFTLPQPDGSNLSLSDLRGTHVLIDFWASWCGPCRKENPNVVRVYQKYKDRGFEILGVSLDKNRNAWLAAIEQDGLTWKHVSDLQYWNSIVVPEYQVQGIPLTYLIGPDGKIIAKNLRGPSLEAKLKELFGE